MSVFDCALLFAEQFSGNEIGYLALADFEVSGGFLGRVGRLLRDNSLVFHAAY
jgi:hypothetical protein